MCVNSKTDRFGFKDESSVKRHLRERHDYSFDKEVTKGESCFVCPPDHWGKKYHSTSLKIHLQKDHQIQTEGTNLKKIKKMYKKVTCFYCKGRIVLAEAD